MSSQSFLIRTDCGLQTSGEDELSRPHQGNISAVQEELKEHGMLLLYLTVCVLNILKIIPTLELKMSFIVIVC